MAKSWGGWAAWWEQKGTWAAGRKPTGAIAIGKAKATLRQDPWRKINFGGGTLNLGLSLWAKSHARWAKTHMQNMPPQDMSLWHIAYFELKALEKRQVQGHSDSPFSSWKQEIKLPCDRYPPCTRRKEDILITKDEDFGAYKSVQTNLVKLTLIFLFVSSFTTPGPNLFVWSILHKFIVCLKGIKSFLFWSLLWVFILLWRVQFTCKTGMFSPVNLSSIIFILRQPETQRG